MSKGKKAVAIGTAAVITGGTGYAIYSSHKGSGSSSPSSSSGGGSNAPADTGEDGTGTDDGTGANGESTGGTLKSRVTEVPIDNYEEAMDFANREWNKIKRDNGHTLECQVQGSCNWKVGEWCKVYLPSFNIDDFMYITRVSQSSDGGEWSTNLSLMDYPPGWGKEELKSDDSEEESEDGTGTADEGTTGEDGETTGEDGTTGENGENGNMMNIDGMNMYYPQP